MLTFKQHMLRESITKTKRVSMQHLQKIKPLDFIQLMSYFKDDLKGKLHAGNVSVTIKADGFGLRFGSDRNKKFFIESSNSGPQFNLGAFAAFDKARHGSATPISAGYDDIMQRLSKFRPLQKLLGDLVDTHGMGIKVVCEALYVPNGVVEGDKIKFIAINYDKKKLGKVATFVLFDILDETGKSLEDSKVIIEELKKLSNADLKFDDPKISPKALDINVEISDFFGMINTHEDIERILTSRKRADKEMKAALQDAIQEYQEKLGKKLLTVVHDAKFSDEFEGIVVQLASGMTFKVVSQTFKTGKAEFNKTYGKGK